MANNDFLQSHCGILSNGSLVGWLGGRFDGKSFGRLFVGYSFTNNVGNKAEGVAHK